MVTTCTRGMECQLANPLKCERERLSPSPVIHGHVLLSVTEALLSPAMLRQTISHVQFHRAFKTRLIMAETLRHTVTFGFLALHKHVYLLTLIT